MNPADAPRDAGAPAWLLALIHEPWRAEVFALLRRLDATGGAPIGHARRARDERVRVGQRPSLAFAEREIAELALDARGLYIGTLGLGMLGPNGALPLHDTERVRERLYAARDSALADFLDLFHHRAITLLYRAWAQAQAAAGLDRRGDEAFTRHVASLCGDAPCLPGSAWPAHARWASAAHRLRPQRDAQGLRAALAEFLEVDVGIEPFVLEWLPIEPGERSRLGDAGRGARLADAAVLGAWVPDRQGRFAIVLGPLCLSRFLQFLPEAAGALPALQACVRAFVGREQAWDVVLLLPAAQVPRAVLGGPDRLARSAWLGEAGAVAGPEGLLRVRFDGESACAATRTAARIAAGEAAAASARAAARSACGASSDFAHPDRPRPAANPA